MRSVLVSSLVVGNCVGLQLTGSENNRVVKLSRDDPVVEVKANDTANPANGTAPVTVDLKTETETVKLPAEPIKTVYFVQAMKEAKDKPCTREYAAGAARPGVPCFSEVSKYPYKTETKEYVDLGERTKRALEGKVIVLLRSLGLLNLLF